MPFRPSQHGWPFGNPFQLEPSALSLGAAPAAELGLGGGMCWAALDRYLAGTRIPDHGEPPAPGSALRAELVRRQIGALDGMWAHVRAWQELPAGSWRDRLPFPIPMPGRDLASRVRAEWPAIRRSLNRGEPILLTLLAEADGYTRSRAAWQALAYGFSREGSRVTLSLYSPDHPGDDDFRLAFSLAGPLDARVTGGRPVPGFFAVPYDRSAPEPVRGETFADRTVIGLNRKIRGRVAPAAAAGRLEVVARDADGNLLHFRRDRGRHWEGANVTERADLGGFQLYSDPVALATTLSLHVFARSYVGDLLHFRRGRSWSAGNRTDQKHAGPRFRLEGDPVPVLVGPGRLSIVARGKDGTLVHHRSAPTGKWVGEDVPCPGGARLRGDPVAVRGEDALHVFGATTAGEILHWRRDRYGWAGANLTATRESGPELRLAGGPVLLSKDGVIHVFGRDPESWLVHLTLEDGRWTAERIMAGIAADPVATTGPAGIHAFAMSADGGLVHAWTGTDRWRTEDVVSTRAELADRAALESGLTAWGSASELRLFGRGPGGLLLFRWRPDCDWTLRTIEEHAGVDERHRPADDPIAVRTADGPHLFGTDGRGTILHVEPGAWTEPEGPAARVPAPAQAPRPPVARSKKADASPARAVETSAAAGLPLLGEADDTPPRAAEEPAAEAPDAGGATPVETDGFDWETVRDKSQPAEVEVEPMDLTMLDTWPPAPRSMQKPRNDPKPRDDKERKAI